MEKAMTVGPNYIPSLSSPRSSEGSVSSRGSVRSSARSSTPIDRTKPQSSSSGIPLDPSSSIALQVAARPSSPVRSSAASNILSSGESVTSSFNSNEDDEPVFKYRRLGGHLGDILARDRASAIAVGSRVIALGTEHGMVHILSFDGVKISSYRPHSANITSIRIDEEDQYVATASFEGRVLLRSLTSPETHAFDYHRPLSSLSLEPDFSKRNSRAFVCGGMAGKLVLQEKGWLGYKEQVLHSGEGPIWAIEWRANLIAWANDLLYDTVNGQRIGFVDRGADAPRAELYRCSLTWKDDSTLIIAWADYIKVIRIRSRSRNQVESGMPALGIDILGIFQMDCMISGIASLDTKLIIVAYLATSEEASDSVSNRTRADRPEIRLIDQGEEVSADALDVPNFQNNGCNQYNLVKLERTSAPLYFAVTPSEIIEIRPRDEMDHINWLVEQERFDEALSSADILNRKLEKPFDTKSIGTQYMQFLLDKAQFDRAAELAPKVYREDSEAWAGGIEQFRVAGHLQAILAYIPVENPRLPPVVYTSVLQSLIPDAKDLYIQLIRSWPNEIYLNEPVLSDIRGELGADKSNPKILECCGETYLAMRQPGKALPYFLQLKQPRVFDMIREFSLFPDIQDSILLLVDQGPPSGAISLLVDHLHSIPIDRVVRQLRSRPEYLFLYLQELFRKDPSLCFNYSKELISLSAVYNSALLLPIFRASNSYDLEQSYEICKERDYVPEMVFLLGRMGNNRQALMLIIERLADVQEAIRFASEQADGDLWEDLLQYSETRPEFIRALLEHVGNEINPIRLIKRIRNGMEIPGLKAALIKIIHTSNLHVSLLDICHRIMESDCSDLSSQLQCAQIGGINLTAAITCSKCDSPFSTHTGLMFLCGHISHAACARLSADTSMPRQQTQNVHGLLSSNRTDSRRRELGNKLSHAASLRTRVGRCPTCVDRVAVEA